MNLNLKSFDIFMLKDFCAPMMKFFIVGLLFLIVSISTVTGQISTLSAWSNFYHGTVNSSATYNVLTGSNSHRILVVAISTTAITTATRTITLSYGGQDLTPINGDLGSTTRQHTQFYFLNEAGLDAATSSMLAFSVSGGTTANNDVFVSVYDYVDQTSPITNSRAYNSGTGTTASVAFGTALTVNAYDLALKVVSSVRIGNTTPRTISNFGTNWTSINQQTGSYNPGGSANDLGIVNAVGTLAIPTSNTTDVSTATLNAATLASMTGISLLEAKSISTGSIIGSPFCAGASVSVPYTIIGTFVGGNIFTAQLSDISGSFASPTNIGNLASTTSGTISATIPAGTATGSGYRIRVVSSNPAITGVDNGVNITINTLPAPTTTGGLICIGSTATLSASGAVSGESYLWYDAATGGNIVKTSADNSDNTFITPTLVLTTDYWVSVRNTTSGCESARTIVTANFPSVSTDNQNDAGANSWIGHVYDGTAFNTYYGRYSETETFNQSFGGTTNCFGITSNSVARSIYTESISVRYRMNSTNKGLYIVDLGSDDGSRLTVDGTLLYNNWADQAYSSRPRILMNLTGTSSLIYDFYENGGGNQVVFQNLTQVFANSLSTNTTQSIIVGSSGTSISGDVYGSLPIGITLSGTGYQWTYSTTLGGARTNISGATGATYIPNASIAPFNVAGTYYIYRNAVLSSANNVAPNPYVATSESNVATLTVYVPTILVSPSSLTGFNYIVGYGPSSQQSFTVSGSNLIDNITVTPTTNYEISTTSGSGFQSTPITLIQSGGTVASTLIYVRLKGGLNAANYNAENIASTSTSAVTKNVACSGTVNASVINTSIATLTGFIYPEGYGPSTEQSFTISGTYLVDNIRVFPSAKFEISTGTGVGFIPTNVITLSVSGGSVNSTTIYVRMKTGLISGTVTAENIGSESLGATTKNVACSGTVVTAPVITTSAISGAFDYIFGSGPSISRTFTVSGSNLGGSVVITPPTNYEISSNGGTNYQSTAITLGLSSGSAAVYTGVLNSTTITVRLKIALGTGSYSENVVATSTSAVTNNVALSGTVSASATIYNNLSFLTGFIYSGAGPSGIISFVVKATALTANVTATPPANFEISKDGVNFQLTPLTLNRVGTVLSTDTIVYVRLKSGLAVGDYGPVSSSIVLTSGGAITKSVACKGKVVNVRTLLVSKNTLTGFGYQFSNGGPSSPQSFTVSGALLGGNIVITPPTNYEISLSSPSGYTSSITLTGTTVNPTIIYVRLKSGLIAASYGTLGTPVNITVATTGVTTVNVACIGKVFVSPLISAFGGGTYCAGSTINLTSIGEDVISQYWTGPNGYYSTLQNPVLTTNATTNLTGTYTANGNVVVGGNLITNGDFEAGNTSFSSGYGYVAPAAGALNPEGLYSITTRASVVHTDFTNQPDHTTGTGTGLQMVVNGSPTAGVVVWSQSVPVIPGATYQFVYSEQTVNITQVPKNASKLQLYVNGVAAGPVYTAPEVNYVWDTFLYNAESGTNTVLNLELVNQNTAATGNDFALDDLIFQQILPATSSTEVIVNPIVPVSVIVDASPGTSVYSNTPVTFTATPTNGGTTPTYQWNVNGLNVGTNSSTFNYTPLDGDVVTCTLTSSLTCVTNNPATATKNMTVTFRLNFWMGYTDTDWGKAENWTGNVVPLTGDDVEYATIANFGESAMRDLWLDMNRTIGSLINATTKRLVIPAGKGLSVNNTVNTDGNADRIYIYSSSTLANGSLSFKNIESMPVSATVEMYSKASWDLAQPTNNKYKWQYFGIPLRSLKAAPTFDGSYVRKWYETGTTIQNHWIQLGNDSILQPFLGYEICQEAPKTFTFKGQLVNKNFNSGQLAITPTALYPGQHIFANPYTAAIDIRQLTFGTQTQATVYLYNTGTFSIWGNDGGFTSGTSAGQYVAIPYNLAGFTGLPRQVPSMQAMLVKAQNVSSEANFGINYNAVIMNNTHLQRVTGVDDISDKVSILIDVKGKQFSDKMWIFTEPGCSNNFDNGWDGYKFLGSSVSPQIFAKEPDGDYQVTTVGDMNNSIIYFQAGEDTEYTLTFTHSNLERYYQNVYLVDLIENKTIEITNSTTEYKFYSESTPKAINRFNIVTRPYEKDASDLNSQVKIFNAGKTVFIHNFSNVDGELMIYDISGRNLKKATFTANGVTTINTNYISGGYIVRAKTSLEEISKRIILR